MDNAENPINAEIKKIAEQQTDLHLYSWDCYFRIRNPNPIGTEPIDRNKDNHTPEHEAKNIYRPLKILNIDFVKNYINNIGDEGHLVAVFGYGQWFKILQWYRDYLEVVLVKKPKKIVSYEEDTSREEVKTVYYAIPKGDTGYATGDVLLERCNRTVVDNRRGMINVEFQLIDLSIEQARAVSVGSTFRDTTAMNVCKYVMAKESEKLTIGDDGKAIEHINIDEPFNEEKRMHVIIPHGTPFLSVPKYLQENCGGLYSNGINTYLQNKTLYIYPPYDLKKIEREEKSLTIFKAPDKQYELAETTYRIEGKKVYIFTTTDLDFTNKGRETFKDKGNAVMYADARVFMNPDVDRGNGIFCERKDNKLIMNPAKGVSLYSVPETNKIMDTPNNYIRMSENNITANPYNEDSKLSMRKGAIYQLTWRNSDASLLYPAMPVKIIYSHDNNEIDEIHGVLLFVHSSIQLADKGAAAGKYIQETVLGVYCSVGEDSETSGQSK